VRFTRIFKQGVDMRVNILPTWTAINKHIAKTKDRTNVAKPIKCSDGFSMSVQASKHHYSTPRSNGTDAYVAYEVGYPSQREELLMPFHECEDSTVFCWVPAEVIIQVILKHGGMRSR
jgi:hypothetical protein